MLLSVPVKSAGRRPSFLSLTLHLPSAVACPAQTCPKVPLHDPSDLVLEGSEALRDIEPAKGGHTFDQGNFDAPHAARSSSAAAASRASSILILSSVSPASRATAAQIDISPPPTSLISSSGFYRRAFDIERRGPEVASAGSSK
jgi:hypothetical protein